VLSDQAAAVVRGRVRFGSAACESLELRSQAHAGDGSVLAEDRRSLRPSDTPDFELNVSGRSHAFVTLALRVFGDRRGGTTCPVTLEALTLATS
jgi:hypothetical protein